MDAANGQDGSSSDRLLAAGVGLLGAALLGYEIVQLRVFAYSLNPGFVYCAIAITMLGFGIAGTALSLSERLRTMPLGPLLALSCAGFAASGLLANAVFARTSHLVRFAPDLATTFTVTAVALVLLSTLPYAFAGIAVASVLSRRAPAAGRLYAANLAGSGLGCVLALPLLRPWGAERLVLVLLALGAAAGVLLAGRGRRRLRVAIAGIAVLLAALTPLADALLPYQPDAYDQLMLVARAYRRHGSGEPLREYAQWDPVGRVEVHSWPGQAIHMPDPAPFKFFSQDGGAGSMVIGLGIATQADARIYDDTVYGVAHQLRPASDVLIIGLGGGPDVQAALRHHARTVTGVEINRAAADAIAGPLAHFAGDPYHAPGVRIVVQDGRSFVRATDRRFDLLQMSGTDTLTVQSSGSFVLAESYLYTVEAFADYLHVLRDDGILAVLRFGLEPYRLVAIGSAALRGMGEDHPERHVIVLSQGRMKLVLIKKTPWTAAEVVEVRGMVADSSRANTGIVFLPYDAYDYRFGAPLVLVYAPGWSGNAPALDRMFRPSDGDRDATSRTIPTDDHPFYFAPELSGYLAGVSLPPVARAQIDTYLQFLGVLVVVALVLILGPLLLLRRRGVRGARALGSLAYFFLLGCCYMIIEIALMQKTVLVVEHPAYSTTVVLAALLLASALGSALAGLWRGPPARLVWIAAGTIVVLGGTLAVWGTPLFDALLPLPFAVRMGAVALIVAPIGAAMGMFFPLGLARLGPTAGALTPWAIGVNGFAAVLGSSISMVLAVLFGFTALFGGAVIGYALAGAAFLALGERAPDAR